MDLMNEIAASYMSMSAARLEEQYSISMMKKSMESEVLAAKEMLEMLPQQPALGKYIDVYA